MHARRLRPPVFASVEPCLHSPRPCTLPAYPQAYAQQEASTQAAELTTACSRSVHLPRYTPPSPCSRRPIALSHGRASWLHHHQPLQQGTHAALLHSPLPRHHSPCTLHRLSATVVASRRRSQADARCNAAIESELLCSLANPPPPLAYKRRRRGALLHHLAACSAYSLACSRFALPRVYRIRPYARAGLDRRRRTR